MSDRRPTQDQLLAWMETLSNWGRWGQDDQKGTLNLITPERTRRAVGLVLPTSSGTGGSTTDSRRRW